MATESSPATPTIEFLRLVAAQQGIYPEDEDLKAVLAFLEAILPVLAEIEGHLPPGTPLL